MSIFRWIYFFVRVSFHFCFDYYLVWHLFHSFDYIFRYFINYTIKYTYLVDDLRIYLTRNVWKYCAPSAISTRQQDTKQVQEIENQKREKDRIYKQMTVNGNRRFNVINILTLISYICKLDNIELIETLFYYILFIDTAPYLLKNIPLHWKSRAFIIW